MGTKRVKIIPDRVFHKLWDRVRDYNSLSSYIDACLSPLSSYYIDLSKYKIDYVTSCDLLKSIFEAANYSISDLIRIIDISNAALSHRFCIPIKTVESWKAAKTDCPGYVKIMIMEEYGIPYLPKYIYTESLDSKRVKTSTQMTSSSNNEPLSDLPMDTNFVSSIINTDSDIKITPSSSNFDFSDIDAYLESLDTKKHFSFKSFESDDNDVKDLLDRTSYLSEHIKKQK